MTTHPQATAAGAAALLALVAGCVHATPVTPSPLAADEEAKLKAALVGECTVTETRKEGGEKKKAEGVTFRFTASGMGSYTAATVLATVNTPPYRYRVEGRNVLMDGPIPALRVDDYSGRTLEMFFYGLSETWYCTKR